MGTDLSVVIPANNEESNLGALIGEVHAALRGRSFELVIVDDGSTDGTPQLLAELSRRDPLLICACHPGPLGKSAALSSGISLANSQRIVTLDGDGQNDPAYIPALVGRLDDPAVGLVAAQRIGRKERVSKRLSSLAANGVRRMVLGDGTRDSGCGLKAFRRQAFLDLPYFESMHRFLPALFLAEGWRVEWVDVVDRPRAHGSSHYGIRDRLFGGTVDLFGVVWLLHRRRGLRAARARPTESRESGSGSGAE